MSERKDDRKISFEYTRSAKTILLGKWWRGLLTVLVVATGYVFAGMAFIALFLMVLAILVLADICVWAIDSYRDG